MAIHKLITKGKARLSAVFEQAACIPALMSLHHPLAPLIPYLYGSMSGKFAHVAMKGMLHVFDTQL